ncbi:MAG: hypothetical protein V1809_07640 [Planctomycetota bacterium]
MGYAKIWRIANVVLLAFAAFWFFLGPGVIVFRVATDPAAATGGIPAHAKSWHRRLAPRYEAWARERVASGAAARARYEQGVPATEWAVFGSVFYILATEHLQADFERNPAGYAGAPAVCARGALDASAALIADPNHGAWVRELWGPDYLHRENVFYRMMVILGLGSYEKLTGDRRHRPLLDDQARTLAAEFERAPHFVLNDYPGECYPCDVLWAVAAIRRADAVLGTDRSAFVRRAIDAFRKIEDERELPGWMADPRSGRAEHSRGVGNSAILVFAPELDPAAAKRWYDAQDRHFWQKRFFNEGLREYPKDMKWEWGFDIDVGPIFFGYGIGTNAFGWGAARACRRFDHARILAANAVACAWPLPDGTLLVPRILSDAASAPYLGEAGFLFNMTFPPSSGMPLVPARGLPPAVWILTAGYFIAGGLVLALAVRILMKKKTSLENVSPARARAALAAWAGCLVLASALFWAGAWGAAIVVALLMQVIPARIVGRAVSVVAKPRNDATVPS